VLGENQEDGPLGNGLSADLLEAARRRNLSANSLAAYERTWTRFLGEGKNAASLKQIRTALSFAYKHWDLKNPFAKIEPPLHNEPQIRYLLLADIRRLLDYLKVRQQGYGRRERFGRIIVYGYGSANRSQFGCYTTSSRSACYRTERL
jgi:hypothetical protein